MPFLYLFFLKKKLTGGVLPFDFFFYNNLYFFFFKKLFLLISSKRENILFFADIASNRMAGLTDLNFFLIKKNYIYIKLANYSIDFLFLDLFRDQFKFYFINNLSVKSLSHHLGELNQGCGLLPICIKPAAYGFYLPVLLDFNFSLFFYKFFFFYLLTTSLI